jgi:hypothetical protein
MKCRVGTTDKGAMSDRLVPILETQDQDFDAPLQTLAVAIC